MKANNFPRGHSVMVLQMESLAFRRAPNEGRGEEGGARAHRVSSSTSARANQNSLNSPLECCRISQESLLAHRGLAARSGQCRVGSSLYPLQPHAEITNQSTNLAEAKI